MKNTKQMKILFANFEMPYLLKDAKYTIGGLAVQILQIANGFTKVGLKVGFLTWDGARKFIGKETDFDIVETYDENIGIKKIRWLYYRYPAIIKAIKNYAPDVIVQGAAGWGTGVYGHIAHLYKIPFVYLVASDVNVDKRIKNSMLLRERLYYYYGLSKANGIVSQNTYQFDKMKEKYPDKQNVIIKNPFNLKEINKPMIKRKYIAWAGNFRYPKNLPALYEIAKINPEYNFKIAGKTCDDIDDKTQKAINDLQKLKNVEFTGYLQRTKISDFLSEAIVLLNTSHYEGLSNTFLEALAVGTPIFSLKSNPSNMITDNHLGEMITINSFKDKINHNINNFDYEKSFKIFRDYLIREHSQQHITSKFLKLFKEI